MDVQTREGIFGGGGYGGGVFDGAQMGFGGLGFAGLGVFPSPSKYPNGYPGATYTAKAGETGGTIARDITGNANKWNELLAKNPETKSTQYGMAFNPGKVLKLPASWQATAGTTTSTQSDTPQSVPAAASPATASFAAAGGDDDGMSTPVVIGVVVAAVAAGLFFMRKK